MKTGMLQDLVKQRVFNYMKENGIGEWPDGRNLETVHVESDQRLVYRPDAPWRYNLLETEIVDDETRDSVTLQQPHFSETPWRMSALLRVEDVITECWMPSGNFVVSQISAHLKIARTELEEHLDTLHKGWREEGVLPREVVALAKLLQRSCYLLGENRLLLKHEIATRRKAICCMVALGHFHLYTNCKFAKKMVATAQEKTHAS